jgi:bifunctional DNase/RNase
MIDVKVTKVENKENLILSDASGKKMTIFNVGMEKALYINEVLEGKKRPDDDVYSLIDSELRRKLMKRIKIGQKPVDATIIYHVLSNQYTGDVNFKVDGSTEKLGEYRASDIILFALRYEIPIRVSDHLLH